MSERNSKQYREELIDFFGAGFFNFDPPKGQPDMFPEMPSQGNKGEGAVSIDTALSEYTAWREGENNDGGEPLSEIFDSDLEYAVPSVFQYIDRIVSRYVEYYDDDDAIVEMYADFLSENSDDIRIDDSDAERYLESKGLDQSDLEDFIQETDPTPDFEHFSSYSGPGRGYIDLGSTGDIGEIEVQFPDALEKAFKNNGKLRDAFSNDMVINSNGLGYISKGGESVCAVLSWRGIKDDFYEWCKDTGRGNFSSAKQESRRMSRPAIREGRSPKKPVSLTNWGVKLEIVEIDMDTNGNKVARFKPAVGSETRAFSIQSNGSLPALHRIDDMQELRQLPESTMAKIAKEVYEYIDKYLPGKKQYLSKGALKESGTQQARRLQESSEYQCLIASSDTHALVVCTDADYDTIESVIEAVHARGDRVDFDLVDTTQKAKDCVSGFIDSWCNTVGRTLTKEYFLDQLVSAGVIEAADEPGNPDIEDVDGVKWARFHKPGLGGSMNTFWASKHDDRTHLRLTGTLNDKESARDALKRGRPQDYHVGEFAGDDEVYSSMRSWLNSKHSNSGLAGKRFGQKK